MKIELSQMRRSKDRRGKKGRERDKKGLEMCYVPALILHEEFKHYVLQTRFNIKKPLFWSESP